MSAAKKTEKPKTTRTRLPAGRQAPKKEEEVVKAPVVAAAAPAAETSEGADFPFDIPKTDRYFEAVGRRKTAIARVRLYSKGDLAIVINDRTLQNYFPTMELQRIVEDPLKKMKSDGRFRISIKLKGGGVHAQAEAARMGIARALTVFNPEFRKRLKRAGFLTRDARAVERKKFGLKKARRAPQWQKR